MKDRSYLGLCRRTTGLALILLSAIASVHAADFKVTATSSEIDYTINDMPASPPLTLVRGRTYTFEIDACSCHPFEILGAPAGSVSNNNISTGTITFNVPLDAGNYSYVCSFHFFGDTITTIDAPPLSAIELWRQDHFGITGNTGDAADMFDFDHDGLPNLVEFAFGSNPKLGTSQQLPQWQMQGGNFSATFPEPAGVTGVTYSAEWSETQLPGSWTTMTDTGAGGQHSFSVPIAGHNKLFARFTVLRPPG
jgi:plastocyanin